MDNELNLVALAQHFSDENKAQGFLEKLRPDGPICPHCGELNNAYRLEPKPSKKDKDVRKPHSPERMACCVSSALRQQKGMGAHQLHRMLKVTYRSAWFMAHRIRYTMT